MPCERLIRIFADLADRDELGGIRLRHAETLAAIERQHLLPDHGGYLVVHDGRDEVYACLSEPEDEEGRSGAVTWVARPLDESEIARIRLGAAESHSAIKQGLIPVAHIDQDHVLICRL